MEEKNVSTILKWITGGMEAFLGAPVIGGMFIVTMAWSPLVIMLALHIVTLLFSIRERRNKHGSILGIITSSLGWIPFLGMIMHIITAIFLLLDAYKSGTSKSYTI